MTFQPGDSVLIVSLKKAGTIVRVTTDEAVVSLGGLSVRCRLTDLRITEPPKNIVNPGAVTLPRMSTAESKKLEKLDLHGRTTKEAIEMIEQHVSLSVLAGLSGFDIVHGLGSGRVQEAAHQCLAKLPVVARFNLDMLNPGVTRVILHRK